MDVAHVAHTVPAVDAAHAVDTVPDVDVASAVDTVPVVDTPQTGEVGSMFGCSMDFLTVAIVVTLDLNKLLLLGYNFLLCILRHKIRVNTKFN